MNGKMVHLELEKMQENHASAIVCNAGKHGSTNVWVQVCVMKVNYGSAGVCKAGKLW